MTISGNRVSLLTVCKCATSQYTCNIWRGILFILIYSGHLINVEMSNGELTFFAKKIRQSARREMFPLLLLLLTRFCFSAKCKKILGNFILLALEKSAIYTIFL